MEKNSLYPCVSVIIINYNKHEDTLECIRSLQASNYPNMMITVVDNDSQNDSVHILRNEAKDTDIIKSGKNGGFAYGNNIGIEHVKKQHTPDYFWLLNADTTVDINALSELVSFAETHPDSGIIGSKLVYYFNPGRIQCLAGGFLNFNILAAGLFSQSFSNAPSDSDFPPFIELDHIVGASMLVRAKAMSSTGLMDESFFMYEEESEWCLRFREKGWKMYGVASSVVYHKEGASSNRYYSRYYCYRNELRIVLRHFPLYFPFYSIRMLAINILRLISFKPEKKRLAKIAFKAMYDFIVNRQGYQDISGFLKKIDS